MRTSAQGQPDSSDELDSFLRSQQTKTAAAAATPNCTVLLLADTIEGAFDEEKEDVAKLKSIFGTDEDKIWGDLIDCANQTKSAGHRSEALRVAAMWERLRAEEFKNLYRSEKTAELERTLPAPRVQPSRKPAVAESAPPPDIGASDRSPISASADIGGSQNLIEASLAKPDVIVIASNSRLSAVDFSNVAAHNRRVCDQVVTIAGLTPNGLALYVPIEGQKFMAKNAKSYPRMCLLQETRGLVPGVPRYLLVWTYSDEAFQGFQPIRRVETTPVPGSGTVNGYGEQWNFTFTGTITSIDTIEAPYIVQSQSLYLKAYDEKGVLVSQHSITRSSQSGGDAAYAAGYNAAGLVSLLWNNPSHLIKNVLGDIQKASAH